MSRPDQPSPDHAWIEVTQLCDRYETWQCAHCDATRTELRSLCQNEETP